MLVCVHIYSIDHIMVIIVDDVVCFVAVSDAARMALWTCMLEDHHLFFQPFLECFKRNNMSRLASNEFPVDLTNHPQLVRQ